jgi:hypothetical protein
MSEDQTRQALDLAARLQAEGHHDAADHVHKAVHGGYAGVAFFHALRDACQTVLTAIEALDPKTQLMAEELRLEVDKRLQ